MNIFNKYFWYDLKFKYWTMLKHKIKLIYNISFVSWDICDSITDITFKMFITFWEEWGHKKDDVIYLKDLKKEKIKYNQPDVKDWYDAILEMKEIYNYIKLIRPKNIELKEKLSEEQLRYIKFNFIDADIEKYPGCKQLDIEYLDGYFAVKYSFDKNNLLKCKKVKPNNGDQHFVSSIENKLNNIDIIYLKKIIEWKDFMWD